MPRPRSSTVRPGHPSVPASVILGPRELKQYTRWQRQSLNVGPHSLGYLHSATEYAAFQSWRAERRDSGYCSASDLTTSFDAVIWGLGPMRQEPEEAKNWVATVCGHALHPSQHAEENVERCPPCTISVHMEYLGLLTRALEKVSDSAHHCTPDQQTQSPVLRAWCSAKVALIRILYQLEELRCREVAWMAQHRPVSLTTADDVKTATQALEKYWGHFEGADACPTDTTREVKEKPSVSFGNDTCFELGRPPHYFWRKSPRYEEGKYTVMAESSGDEEMDGEEELGEEQGDDDPADSDDEDEWEDIDSESDDGDDEDGEENEYEVVVGAEFVVFEA